MKEIDAKALRSRIDVALQRIKDGLAPMRIPADPGDPDLVLADCRALCDEAEKFDSDARQQLRERSRDLDAMELVAAEVKAARRALAESQAREAVLRKTLREFYPCGRISHDRLSCERPLGHIGFHSSTDGAQINWPEKEAVGWEKLPACLTAPTDTSALRDFMIRARAHGRPAADAETAVDAVLRGDS